MNKARFIQMEYATLREEIKETKGRVFKIAALGLIGMPSAYSFAKVYDIHALVLSLPILICTITLLYLYEIRAAMRCGTYIKKKIEPVIENNDNGLGWENWLMESDKGETDRRMTDKLLSFFFYLLFIFYYIAAVQLAADTANIKYGFVGFSITLAFYVGVGVVFVSFLVVNFKSSTTTL